MIRSYKVRIYPTKEQEILMNKHINCCRFIWNYMLGLNLEREKLDKYPLRKFAMCNELTLLKKQPQYKWLNGVSTDSLQIVCGDLDEAYKAFFGRLEENQNLRKRRNLKERFRLDVIEPILRTTSILQYLLLVKLGIKQTLIFNTGLMLLELRILEYLTLETNGFLRLR